MRLTEQLRRNQLAIISLLVALTALGYNTWRNELTEANRTVRQAGFEMLMHIGELQRITYLAHYDQDSVGGNPRKGWAEVLLLKDLGTLMPSGTQMSTDELFQAWEESWARLGSDENAVSTIDNAIDKLRAELQIALAELD
jgi:hypothetical protein